MAYRGDETDPLEIILRQRRAMRRAALMTMVMALLSSLWRVDYARVVPAVLRASPPHPLPISAPGTEHAPAGSAALKMTAAEVQQHLDRAVASAGGPRDPRCAPGLSGWDYFCSYRAGANPAASRVKIGVLVGSTGIVHISPPYPIDRALPTAPVVGSH